MRTLHNTLIFALVAPASIMVACGGSSGGTSDLAGPVLVAEAGARPDDDGGVAQEPDAQAHDHGGSMPEADGAAGDAGAVVDAGPRPPSVVPLCVHARNAAKAILDRCCMADTTNLVGYIDRNCDALYGASFAAGRLFPDPAGEAQCFAALDAAANAASCAMYKDDLLLPYASATANQTGTVAHAFAACGGVMKGTVVATGNCVLDSDCQDGLTCVGATPLDSQPTLGKCQLPADLGGLCDQGATRPGFTIRVHAPLGNHPECAQGYCHATHCEAQGTAGASCFGDRECSAGLACANGTCTDAPSPKLGEPCTDRCADDYAFCFRPGNAATGTCTKPRVVGQSCERNGDCEGACNVADGGTAGTCVSQCGSL